MWRMKILPECALRELAEETPYVADSVKLLVHLYTAVGFCDEKNGISTKRKGVRLGSELSKR